MNQGLATKIKAVFERIFHNAHANAMLPIYICVCTLYVGACVCIPTTLSHEQKQSQRTPTGFPWPA